jgi:hypothetical protein
LEEANMIKQTLALAAATVVLGALAFAPESAFAQARNVNDGGQVNVPAGAKLDGGSKSAASSTYYGRNANDGGTGPQPAAVQTGATTAKLSKASSKASAAPAPVHLGRSVNDGGSIN